MNTSRSWSTSFALFVAAALGAAAAAQSPRAGTSPTPPTGFHRAAPSGLRAADPPDDGGLATPMCGPIVLTQNTDPVTIEIGNTFACSVDGVFTYENFVARVFTTPQQFVLGCVEFGIDENVGGASSVEVTVFSGNIVSNPGAPALAQVVVAIPDNVSAQLFVANMPAGIVIPPGGTFSIQFRTPSRDPSAGGDGGEIYLGSNNNGQTAPTYVKAPTCGVVGYVSFAAVGFPGIHMLMSLGGAPAIPAYTEGVLLCADGTPLVGCAVTLDYHDSTGLVSTVVTTTDGSGYFNVIASCTLSNGVGEHFIVSTPCCAHTWTIFTTCCCGDLGTLTCDCCEPFEQCCPENDACPTGAIDEQEFEPCGLDLLNGGCNSTPTTFQQIACGDTICGTFWFDGTTRDTDWYEFTLSQPQEIVWSVWADVPVTVLVLNANCPPDILAIGVGTCPSVAATTCVPAGTYRVFVAPDFLSPLITCLDPSNAWRYLAVLDCKPCPSSCDPGFGSCFAVHPWGGCDDANCCLTVCSTPGYAHCCNVAWDQSCVAFAWTFGECQSGFMNCPFGSTPTVHVCEGGCRDAFATTDGPEPANGTSCTCSACVDFDVVAPNQCFQHTFVDCWPSCPAGCGPFACGEIVGAFLEIGTKFVDASSDPVDIFDSLELLDAGTAVASFSLLGANSVVDATGTVFLDLGNLPFGGGSILSTLCDGELGIVIADDRAVDYAWLTVIHCPCKFQFRPLHAGDADDSFTTPTPANPDPTIVNHVIGLGGVVAPNYDTIVCNRWFLESFDNLPPCIDRSELFVGLRQCEPFCGPSDDTISIEVVQKCGKTYGWSMPLSALGPYLSTTPIGCTTTTLLSLDLANLPPDANNVTDVVGLLLDGRLDILIEDDTAVDYIYLYPTVCDCCDGDIDGDGIVNGADLGALLANWNGGGVGDLDGDGVVNGGDLGVVLAAWGPCGDTGGEDDPVAIMDCQPSAGGHGTLITIAGLGFGFEEDDLCVVLAPQGNVAARALLAGGNTLKATVGAVPPGASAGQWMVMKGSGVTVALPPTSIFTGTTEAWAWVGTEAPGVAAQCGGGFTPVPDPLTCKVTTFFKAGNQAVAILPATACSGTPNDYPPGTELEVDVHFDCAGKHYDCFVPTITIFGGSIGYTANDVAVEIKNKLQQCFNAVAPGEVVVSVNLDNVLIKLANPDCVINNVGGTVKIKPNPPC